MGIIDVFKSIAIVFEPQQYSSSIEILKEKAKHVVDRLQSAKLQSLQFDTSSASASNIRKELSTEAKDTDPTSRLCSRCSGLLDAVEESLPLEESKPPKLTPPFEPSFGPFRF